MKPFVITFALCSIAFGAGAQIKLDKIVKEAEKVVKGESSLTNDEVVNGLKEALQVGTNNSTASASKVDGFYKNSLIKIPFPQDAIKAKTTLENMGMKKQVQKFEMSINRAAEEAAKSAAPIFMDAITSMSITDGFNILKGSDNAATKYLDEKTRTSLQAKFKPIIANAINKVEVTKYWKPLAKKYNSIPFVDQVNPNLEEYITLRALDGLFKLIESEELKIRKDPAARVSDLLKKVFK